MKRHNHKETTKEKIIATVIWLVIWAGVAYVGLNSGNAGYIIIALAIMFLYAFLAAIWDY